MKLAKVKQLVAYIDTLPEERTKWFDLVACFDGYIALQCERDEVDDDVMFELGYTWDDDNDWYSFDEDRGV